MVKFQFEKNPELFQSMVDLMDLIRKRPNKYPNTHIGPFEDFALVYLGIIIDGKEQKKLSDDFERILLKKEVTYARGNKYSIRFFENRDY